MTATSSTYHLDPLPRKVRVLVVDDSATVRAVLSRALSSHPQIEVVGTAPDPYVAREKILELCPDVLTLDVEMPRMDGITFLTRLMAAMPMPVIVVSSLTSAGADTTLRALEAGAVDVLHKPSAESPPQLLAEELCARVLLAARSNPHPSTLDLTTQAPSTPPRPSANESRPSTIPAPTSDIPPRTSPLLPATSDIRHPTSHIGHRTADIAHRTPDLPYHRLVALGASTGGVQALTRLLTAFPHRCPATVVVQHMPAKFTATFAQRLDQLCACRVAEARDGDVLREGLVLLAPGGMHLLIRREADKLLVRLKDGPPVFHQKPAVEVMFDSLARLCPDRVAAAILTGMGTDGAAALLRLRQSGARTFAEHESTAIVYGMPAEAVRLDAADRVLPLDRLAPALLQAAA